MALNLHKTKIMAGPFTPPKNKAPQIKIMARHCPYKKPRMIKIMTGLFIGPKEYSYLGVNVL